MPPARFAAHLDALSTRAQLVPLSDCLTRAKQPRIAITVDGGYADTEAVAREMLEPRRVPVTVFAPRQRAWRDRLAYLFRQADSEARLELALGGALITLRCGEPAGRGLWIHGLHQRLMRLSFEEVDRALDEIASQLGVHSEGDDEWAVLGEEALKRLASSTVVEIGASTADPKAIGTDKKHLEALIEQRVDHFAHPTGPTDEVDDAVVEAVRRAGYRTACTTSPGKVPSNPDPFRLPRMAVAVGWESEELLGRLRFLI